MAAHQKSHRLARREYEFAEFIEPVYKWFVKHVTRIDEETLEIALQDGRTATVKRSTDYLQAPVVHVDGKRIGDSSYEFFPALTSVRWLMMLLCMIPESPC